MKYLLDTHTFIWYFDLKGQLPEVDRDLIMNPQNDIYISSASLWEIAIKLNLKKIDFNIDLPDLIQQITDNGFAIIQIKDEYQYEYINLPLIHQDPFDRLLVATAKAEDMTIITNDKNIHKYETKWIW